MNKINIEKISFLPGKARCVCGKCDHKVLQVVFNNGTEWFPTNKEYAVLKEMLQNILTYNLRNDQYCFKKEQEVNIREVLE